MTIKQSRMVSFLHLLLHLQSDILLEAFFTAFFIIRSLFTDFPFKVGSYINRDCPALKMPMIQRTVFFPIVRHSLFLLSLL